ncbi:MAG: transcription elongation factor NusA [Vulcanisaeta sp.]|nr:transcription elongation factor NusA [Vulcanisaeta sp.]MCG2869224.1 transcription elongation factor NusA [Vulcanisaeta sp.]MCG2880921.1 transcription elongation factor NusA [Vulcanisaeta sp.]MCG2886604.1 transcription elongation factor NusA [Vulcanisaeta sp.]MCG2895429.1 transcription elongation factor NusA [Vulcanisaeta sp.]
MKIPFCTFCVKTRVFCNKCQSLLDSGEYSMLDVEVTDALLNIATGKMEEVLRNVEYVKSYEIGDLVIVVLKGVKALPRAVIQQIEHDLERALNKRVRIVERGVNINELATQLASPARILTISTSWLPDGTTETIVRIARSELKRLPFKPSELAKVLSQISGTNIRVEITK